MGSVARAQGEFTRAAEVFTQALTLAKDQGLGEWQAAALFNLGTVTYWQGDWERGIALNTEALTLFRRKDDNYGTAIALSDMVLMASQGPDRARAAVLFRESLDAWRQVGTKEGLVEWLARVATLAITSRRTEPGVRLLGAVERATEMTGYRFEPQEYALQERACSPPRSRLRVQKRLPPRWKKVAG